MVKAPKEEKLRWPISSTLAKKLQTRMADLGMEPIDVARALGLTQDVHVRRILRIGAVKPILSSELLPELCRVLKLSKLESMPLDEQQLTLLEALRVMRDAGVADVDTVVDDFVATASRRLQRMVEDRADIPKPAQPPVPSPLKSRGTS